MPRPDNSASLRSSFLDRLLDDEPDVKQEPLSYYAQSIHQIKKTVTRDLEAMLNTRQEQLEELPAEFAEVRRSLCMYGLPDFTACSVHNTHDRNVIRRAIERTIATFEPRLERVRVLIDTPQAHEQAVHFRIEAMLRVEPSPEPVMFDATLQLQTQEYVVQGHD